MKFSILPLNRVLFFVSGSQCDFCSSSPCSSSPPKRVPRPYPDAVALPKFRYLPYDKIPSYVNEQQTEHWPQDDFQPRALLKKLFAEGIIQYLCVKAVCYFIRCPLCTACCYILSYDFLSLLLTKFLLNIRSDFSGG